MTGSFPFEILTPGAPTQPSFTVSEVPHQAKLDQNESPIDLPDEIKQVLLQALSDKPWNRYPQPADYLEIKEHFALAIGLKPENIVLTVGGDQMILGAYWAAGGKGRKARIFEPAYPIFNAYARTTQTDLDRVVLGPDFDVDAHGLGDPVDLLMLVNPNNPTGNGPSRDLLVQALEHKCLVFLDEAYADFSRETAIDLIDDHPNLLIGRSLSKSLLAGIRLGFGIGHPVLINVLERLLFAPYHLNALQMVIARHYNIVKPLLNNMVQDVIMQRNRVETNLTGMGIKVWPSNANFLQFEVENAARTYKGLLANGVRIRDISSMPGMGEHLRVTIGTKPENDLFLNAIAKSL